MSFAAKYINAWLRVAETVDVTAVERAVEVLVAARERDATVWTVGNGGCGALASHLAIGLTLNTRRSGGRPFRAVCLSADAAALSAAVNDFGSREALSALLECNGRAGDVLCAFTVSGESANVNQAIAAAGAADMPVVALVGTPGSTAARLADHPVLLGSAEPGIAEDVASAVMHAMYCSFMYEGSPSLPEGFSGAH
ncbi:SIS domain-containing protein [Streptomyces europaeiscabiei]|uniref:SIS domain-containing protein n=1 Tax=Streptomyces europaeiscabiei TaxID=146819 RepID=UPI0029B15547|nr:SIS domain-containing protein [Streptomyces europaeiscabiei]MDX3866859.1 SIS domain-containing protein [Streptomyces europaeiscabiei]MDX3873113.1 SIS domain-containing protein [Streptomyces europaeiscabiei]